MAIKELFTDKYLNRGELFPLMLREGKIVLKVKCQQIDSMVAASSQNFGTVVDESILRFKVSQKSASAIKVNSNEAKQLFKDNISF